MTSFAAAMTRRLLYIYIHCSNELSSGWQRQQYYYRKYEPPLSFSCMDPRNDVALFGWRIACQDDYFRALNLTAELGMTLLTCIIETI
jgi:hypothetical protein